MKLVETDIVTSERERGIEKGSGQLLIVFTSMYTEKQAAHGGELNVNDEWSKASRDRRASARNNGAPNVYEDSTNLRATLDPKKTEVQNVAQVVGSQFND